jgi:hypothetical protein
MNVLNKHTSRRFILAYGIVQYGAVAMTVLPFSVPSVVHTDRAHRRLYNNSLMYVPYEFSCVGENL